MKKEQSPTVDTAFIDYIKHIHSSYESVSVLLEHDAAAILHRHLYRAVYTLLPGRASTSPSLSKKVDLTSTLGGDGTILHAASLFSEALTVPPILSFSMGTLGFLGEWKFQEHKRAFREVFVSGAESSFDLRALENNKIFRDESSPGSRPVPPEPASSPPTSWSTIRGKAMGHSRNARVLLRNRLKVGLYSPEAENITDAAGASSEKDIFAMNEVIIHRGRDPHLAVVEVFVGGRFLTEAVADGMIISTPTGSTAYSLSSGGSIVHPLVSSLLLTPVCPRSLSFRPLVLPGNTPITLRLSEKNRGPKVDVSIDGVLRSEGLSVGMEIRVQAEDIRDAEGRWVGGVPSIVRAHAGADAGSEDSWVGGLNGLLKFNYPMGEG